MQTSSTASGVANMYSFSNQNSLATTPIDTAASQIMVELEPGAVGRTGTMGRGNTFCASGARTLQRNGGKSRRTGTRTCSKARVGKH